MTTPDMPSALAISFFRHVLAHDRQTTTYQQIARDLGTNAATLEALLVQLRADGYLSPTGLKLTDRAREAVADAHLGLDPTTEAYPSAMTRMSIDDVAEDELGVVPSPDADGRPNPFGAKRLDARLKNVVSTLSPREKEILARRFGRG
ncbi:MAG: hypothetical protein ACHREM_00030 [Polyangiales bacterium]